MKFDQIKNLSSEKFRRLTGLKRKTFDELVEFLKEEKVKKFSDGGREKKLVIEDQLLMTLEYQREYRTYFHIGVNYEVSESCVLRTVRWVEDRLSKNPKFDLPGKISLLDIDNQSKTIIIDATESQIERPKENQGKFYSGKKKAYFEKSDYCR